MANSCDLGDRGKKNGSEKREHPQAMDTKEKQQ